MFTRLYQLAVHFYWNLRLNLNANVETSHRIQIKKKPIIDVRKGAKLRIGANVTLNSNNQSYHVNMFAPVKIFAKLPGSFIQIGDNTRIHGSCIHAQKSVSIGKNCLIAANCQIMDGSGHELQTSKRLDVSTRARAIVIEDNVWLGTGVIVLPGTLIKRGSVISAGSVVSGTIEENSLMVGNPARLKKKLV